MRMCFSFDVSICSYLIVDAQHYLTGEMGLAFVQGLQGKPRIGASSTATVSAAATCKHLLAL